MPCILKQSVPGSPGIITFTHGEALWGLPKRSKRVREFLIDAKQRGEWLFGIHVQGDCSYLESWPMPEWQSFVMWPEQAAPFLRNLPADEFCPYTCINFMPSFLVERPSEKKEWDICVISRASSIKRIETTLLLLREILNAKPDAKINLIVPDPRRQELGRKAYAKQSIDESYFTLPRKLFSARELKGMTFISSSQETFGNFPLSDDMMASILGRSRFMMLTSHLEGVPRVIAEALLVGTPCVVSEDLRSGLNGRLNALNSVKIAVDPIVGAGQVVDALVHYDRLRVDRGEAKLLFSESQHLAGLKDFLSSKIKARAFGIEGAWYLEDLHLRLACHGQKEQFQFFNREELFFSWLDRARRLEGAYADEDFLGGHGASDTPTPAQRLRIALGPVLRVVRSAIRH